MLVEAPARVGIDGGDVSPGERHVLPEQAAAAAQQAVTVGLQIRVLVALVVHDAAAQFQALIEQARAQRPVDRQLGNGLGQQVATDEAVLHAVRHQAAVRVQQHRHR
ncbi:hypothetical protein G6F65_012605 [Rhizopus arrhizus]|nr:hypothetical protein G6F65_012605 [Rhizopus arrhizus]